METKNETTKAKRKVTGVVVSDKMQNTIVVKVTKRKPHPKYKRIITRSNKFMVHVLDDSKKPSIGEEVTIQEYKPVSKNKSWILVK